MSNCLKIVNTMPQADQDALLTRLGNYQAVGMSPKQAQVEAAKETLKRLEAEMPLVQHSARSPLGFYSALADGIESIATKQQAAGGWLAQIKGLVNKGAVKQDELEWSGLTDWLNLQAGKITKEQITGYLNANGVQVEETVLGDAKARVTKYENQLYEWAQSQEDTGKKSIFTDAVMSGASADETLRLAKNENVPEAVLNMARGFYDALSKKDAPKFSTYVVPGGKNYREVLLTLPTKLSDYGTWLNGSPVTQEDIATQNGRDTAERIAGVSGYQSAHWDQKNVLAHMRVDDRVDSDGNKVLFVEELQSDYGQEAKKKGFASTKYTTLNALNGKVKEYATKEEAKSASSAPGTALQYREENISGLPRAPFVDTTDKWLTLALKRVITMAAEGGYDKVAFANGEQNAQHYDLSKQISRVEYTDNGVLIAVDTNGREVMREKVAEENIEDHIGKEAARKLLESRPVRDPGRGDINAKTRRIEGDGLRMGGEGMKAFYDRIIPNTVNALLKKVGGGKVERVDSVAIGADKDNEGNTFADKEQGIFTITPAMREKVSAGVPLFSKRDQTDTQEFKAWFGDWQSAVNAKIINGDPITKLNSADAPQGGFADVVVWVKQMFAKQGGLASRPGFGDVVLDGRSAKSSLAHGGANKYKKVAFAAAKDVIERGALVKQNSGSEEDSFYFSAPVEIDGVVNIETVLVHRDINTKRMYLHSVTTKENLLNPRVSSADAEASERSGSTSPRDVASVLQKLLTFKSDGVSKVVDAGGKPLVVYHGTHKSFDAFDPQVDPLNWESDRGLQFFLDSAYGASMYAEGNVDAYGGNANVVPVYLSMQNPRVETTDLSPSEFWDREGASLQKFHPDVDGFIIKGDGETVYVTKSPSQIKSIFNNGDFDAGNADIRKSLRDNQQTLDEEKKENFYVDLRNRLGSGGFGNYPGPELHAALLGLERQGVHLREAVVVHDTGRDGSTVVRWTDQSTPFKEYLTAGFDVRANNGDVGFQMPIVPAHYLSEAPTAREVFDAALSGMAANTVEMRRRDDGAFDVAFRGPKFEGRFHQDYLKATINTGLTDSEGMPYIQVPVGPSVTKSWMREALRRYAMLHGGSLPDMAMARATGANPSLKESTRPGADMELRFSARDEVAYSIRPEASYYDDLRYKWQDKHIDTKRVVDAIKAKAGQIADALNVYLQEELFHGRAAKRVADFGKEALQPLMEQIGRDGYTIADVEEYLQARHAPEANRVIAQRNPNEPGLQDGGSGMTNAVAATYMANLSASDAQKLAGIAAQVDAIIKQTRQLYVDYNLEGQDTVDAWAQMFQNYIPLQREDKEGRMGIGQGFSVKGKETKGRTGSTRKVVDVLANIALQREKLIVRGEKNRVATALVGLAMANPDPDLWSVGPPPSTRVYDPKTNTVVDRVDPMYKSRDEVLVAKVNVNGKIQEMAVVFNKEDPRALRMVTALKNLDANSLEGVLAVSAMVTRYFSAINTQYNPVFGVVNLIRDVQGAMINLGETPLAGHRIEIAKNTMSALAGIYADMRAQQNGQRGTSAWAHLFEEFELEGGQTGFRDLFKTSTDRAEALQKILTPDAWMDSRLGKIFTVNGKLKVPVSEARKGAVWIFDWLSDYNGAMENSVRLSAYKAGLDAGMSKQQAASLAKNLTVNFNRKGQAGQQAGALYAFFNAAMQGSARMGQTLFTMQPGKPKTIRLSSTGKRIVYGGILLGTIQALALAASGFDDKDPPEFLRERSLILPTRWTGIGPKKGYVSIPMPLGFHVIPGIGRHAAEFALSGFEKPQKRIVSMIGMFMDAFNPIGNAGLSMQTFAPTAFDPFVALRENKDWTGRPIARTSSNKAIPGHTQYKDTATAPAKWIAEAINLITGGNEYVAGVMSPTPDQVDYLIGQVTGGVGRELSKVEQTVKAVVTGEELPTFKVPLAGRFFGNADSQASQAGAFYDNVNKLNEIETEVKGMRKDGKIAEAVALIRSQPNAYMIKRANVAERQVQRLRREKRELLKKGVDRSVIKAKEHQITETMKRLNDALREKG